MYEMIGNVQLQAARMNFVFRKFRQLASCKRNTQTKTKSTWLANYLAKRWEFKTIYL